MTTHAPFTYIVTENNVVFTSMAGKPISVATTHHNFLKVKDVIKEIAAGANGDIIAARQNLEVLSQAAQAIIHHGLGRVTVKNGEVFFDGSVVHNSVTKRIIWGVGEGFDMKPYIAFLENIMDNPSNQTVEELYDFLEANDMGVTEDGHIIAYKKVRGDYTDIYTGEFDNSVGKIIQMPRNKVNDRRNETCSHGLHACSFSYLKSFGSHSGNDRVMIVKINPRDVVSVPSDYKNAKMRSCRYEVIGEYEGTVDVLASKPVWKDNDWKPANPPKTAKSSKVTLTNTVAVRVQYDSYSSASTREGVIVSYDLAKGNFTVRHEDRGFRTYSAVYVIELTDMRTNDVYSSENDILSFLEELS